MTTHIQLPARPPFWLTSVIQSHGWAQLAPFATDDRAAVLRYVDRLASGRVVDYRLRPEGDGVGVEVGGTLDAAEAEEVAGQVTWMLGLEQDLAPFYERARGEPRLAQVETQARGRVLRSPTLWEDTVKTILTTNTAWGGTIRMVQALVDNYGDPLPASPDRRAFPTPERLADADPDELQATARLGYRAPYVVWLARSMAGGELDLEGFKRSTVPTAELRHDLMGIRGVGSYAAANLLLLLGRYDYLPVDSWALRLVSRHWHDGRPVGQAEVEAAFAAWGEWKGLAYWFWEWPDAGT